MKRNQFWLTLLFSFLLFIISNESKSQWQNLTVIEYDSGSYSNVDYNFINESTGYSVGHITYYPGINPAYRGRILKTTNGGNNWIRQNIPTSKILYYLELLDADFAYVSGDSNTFIKTNNGGTTWVLVPTPVISTLRYDWRMSFINNNTGWITSSINPGQTFKTINGGTSWTSVSNLSFHKIKFLNDNLGFGINNNGFYTTNNGGLNWTLTLNDSLMNEFYFLNNTTGWCFSKRSNSSAVPGKSWMTTNGGSNWSLLNSNDTSLNGYSSVRFFDSNTGYANNNYSPTKMVKTTNGGIEWFNPQYLRFNLSTIRFLNSSYGWACDNTVQQLIKFLYTASGPGNSNNPFFCSIGPVYQNSNNINNRIGYRNICDWDVTEALEWPKGQGKHLVYSAGLNIAAKVNNELKVAYSRYGASDWTVGFIDDSGIPQGNNFPDYGFYQIKTGDGPGIPDWDHWPISQGAPSVNGQPLLLGNQTTFASLTAGFGGILSEPLKAEVKMTTYGFNSPPPNDDVIYMKFNIINRSGSNWDSTYISFLVDTDIGDYSDDRAGNDTTLKLAYAYNGSNNDPIYGINPPAFGIKVLESPTNNAASSSVYFIGAGTDPCFSDPNYANELYNYMKGLNKCGDPYLYNSIPQKFTYTGNPETGTEWLQHVSADMRLAINSGPITLANNQTATILIALIAARGTSNTNSVTKLKQIASQIPIGINSLGTQIPVSHKLYQNFPNPFNPVTNIKFDLPKNNFVKLIIYDLLGKEIETLINKKMDAGSYKVDWNAGNYPSGVYFYKLSAGDFVETKRMLLVK